MKKQRGSITRQTHKRRIARLEDLLKSISTANLHAGFLYEHARPAADDFMANWYYKSALEVIKAATWTTWLLAKHEIEKYKKKQPVRKK
jgi:hypothetical protein